MSTGAFSGTEMIVSPPARRVGPIDREEVEVIPSILRLESQSAVSIRGSELGSATRHAFRGLHEQCSGDNLDSKACTALAHNPAHPELGRHL